MPVHIEQKYLFPCVFNKKCLSRKVKWGLFPSFPTKERSKLWRQYNITYSWSPKSPLDRVIPESGGRGKNKSTARGNEEWVRWTHRIAVTSQSLIFREKEESARIRGSGRRRGGGSRIDRRRWGPTSRRLDLVWVKLFKFGSREKRDPFGIHSLSLLFCIYITLAGLGVQKGTKYEGTERDETHLTTLARFALGVDGAPWIWVSGPSRAKDTSNDRSLPLSLSFLHPFVLQTTLPPLPFSLPLSLLLFRSINLHIGISVLLLWQQRHADLPFEIYA